MLAECDACGIRPALADCGGLEIDAPQDALTPRLLDRLTAHKAELLAMLRPAPEAAPAKPAKAVCRCGRFLDFPVWYDHATADRSDG